MAIYGLTEPQAQALEIIDGEVFISGDDIESRGVTLETMRELAGREFIAPVDQRHVKLSEKGRAALSEYRLQQRS